MAIHYPEFQSPALYNPGRNATTKVKIPQATAKMTPTVWATLVTSGNRLMWAQTDAKAIHSSGIAKSQRLRRSRFCKYRETVSDPLA